MEAVYESLNAMLEKIGEAPIEKHNIYMSNRTENDIYVIHHNEPSQYRMTYQERGVTSNIFCGTIQDLEYEVAKMVVEKIAQNYEANNRILFQDSRRLWMQYSVEVIGKINPEFSIKLKKHYKEILENNPFDDELMLAWDARETLVKLFRRMVKESPWWLFKFHLSAFSFFLRIKHRRKQKFMPYTRILYSRICLFFRIKPREPNLDQAIRKFNKSSPTKNNIDIFVFSDPIHNFYKKYKKIIQKIDGGKLAQEFEEVMAKIT